MQLKLVQKTEGCRPNSVYQQAKNAHQEAMRLLNMAGISAMDGPSDGFDSRMQQYSVLQNNEKEMRRAFVHAPVLTADDVKDKAAYFRQLMENEWIEVSPEDVATLLMSFEKMDG